VSCKAKERHTNSRYFPMKQDDEELMNEIYICR
jgi:hypothetical protein